MHVWEKKTKAIQFVRETQGVAPEGVSSFFETDRLDFKRMSLFIVTPGSIELMQ